MSRLSNQELEQYYFKQFQAHYPMPPGQVEHRDKPDVLILGHRTLGIEIVNFYLSHATNLGSEQTQRPVRDLVVKEAQAEYLASGGKKSELTFSFDPSHPISISDWKALATALARVAVTIEKLPAGQVNRSHFQDVPEICFIYHNPTEYHDAKWHASQVYTVPNLSLSRLAEIVESKHSKLAGYKPCDAYWLLLIVDFTDPAQDQEIDWPESEVSLKSPFEKIIIYKPQFAAWTEIPTQQ